MQALNVAAWKTHLVTEAAAMSRANTNFETSASFSCLLKCDSWSMTDVGTEVILWTHPAPFSGIEHSSNGSQDSFIDSMPATVSPQDWTQNQFSQSVVAAIWKEDTFSPVLSRGGHVGDCFLRSHLFDSQDSNPKKVHRGHCV